MRERGKQSVEELRIVLIQNNGKLSAIAAALAVLLDRIKTQQEQNRVLLG
jgi:hypothetical protein